MYNIISDDESWIYWQDKRQSSDWVFPGEENLTKVIRLRSVSKKMVWTFVSKADHVALLPLQDHRTVTTDCYATICLPKVIAKLWKTNQLTNHHPPKQCKFVQFARQLNFSVQSRLKSQRFFYFSRTESLAVPTKEWNNSFQNTKVY